MCAPKVTYRKSNNGGVFLTLPHMYFASRIKENGQERTEIEEDGVLKKVLINGKPTNWWDGDN